MNKSIVNLVCVVFFISHVFTFADPEMDTKKNITLTAPEGNCLPVLIDGIFSTDEWTDAAKMKINKSAVLFFKEKLGHVFIGVKLTRLKSPCIDLFITTDKKEICQMHVSAQLGERILTEIPEPGKGPAYRFGWTKDWYANEVRWDETWLRQMEKSSGKSRDEIFYKAVYPFDGFEFQIKKSKFNGRIWFFKIRIASHPHWDKPILFPSDGELNDLTNWVKLILK